MRTGDQILHVSIDFVKNCELEASLGLASACPPPPAGWRGFGTGGFSRIFFWAHF